MEREWHNWVPSSVSAAQIRREGRSTNRFEFNNAGRLASANGPGLAHSLHSDANAWLLGPGGRITPAV